MVEDQDLIERYIEANPNRPGVAEVRLVHHGVPIWALIGHLEAVDGSIERTAEDYEVPVDSIRAALAYYRRHKNAIDARLAANAA